MATFALSSNRKAKSELIVVLFVGVAAVDETGALALNICATFQRAGQILKYYFVPATCFNTWVQ